MDLSKEQFLKACRKRIERQGGVQTWAIAYDFPYAYVYAILRGASPPSKRFLAAVRGKRLPERYRFLEDEPNDT